MTYQLSDSQIAANQRIMARRVAKEEAALRAASSRPETLHDAEPQPDTAALDAHYQPAEPPLLTLPTRYDPYEESVLPVPAKALGDAADRERGGGERHPGNPAPQPNLGTLIEALPSDDTRAPQTQFTLDLRIAFLETLAVNGSVRASARRVRVSHQTVYRARRGSAAFGRAWDAALVIARGQAEAKLADLALGGVQEEVWYHGELVGHRQRFSERLLLAHLGRLDKMRADTRVDALAEDFDGMIARMRAGGPIDATAPAAEAETPAPAPPPAEEPILTPGQRHTRSMSDANAPAPSRDEAPLAMKCDCPGAQDGTDGGAAHFRMTAEGPEPVANIEGGGPCCATPAWPDCRDCPHYPAGQMLEEMEEQRPADAPPIEMLGEPDKVRKCQIDAFEAGDEDWWRYGEDFVWFEQDDQGDWHAEPGDGEEPEMEADDARDEGADPDTPLPGVSDPEPVSHGDPVAASEQHGSTKEEQSTAGAPAERSSTFYPVPVHTPVSHRELVAAGLKL